MSLLKIWLERKKYQIKFTSKADEVIPLSIDFSPDLAIIDVLQHKTAEQVKSDPVTSTIPIMGKKGSTDF